MTTPTEATPGEHGTVPDRGRWQLGVLKRLSELSLIVKPLCLSRGSQFSRTLPPALFPNVIPSRHFVTLQLKVGRQIQSWGKDLRG